MTRIDSKIQRTALLIITLIVATTFILTVLTADPPGARKLIIDTTFYKNSSVDVNSVEMRDLEQLTPLNKENGEYALIILNSDGEVVKKGKFNLGFQAVGLVRGNNTNGSVTLRSRNRINKTFYLNFREEMTQINWTYRDENVQTTDIVQRLCDDDGRPRSYCKQHGAESQKSSLPILLSIAIAVILSAAIRYSSIDIRNSASSIYNQLRQNPQNSESRIKLGGFKE